MARWKQSLSRSLRGAIYRTERRLDRWKHGVKRRMGWFEPMHVLPYRGFGTPDEMRLRGRVLEDKQIGSPRAEDSWWRNLCNAYRRFDSDEIPHVRIRATYHGEVQETETNDQGYFDLCFHPQTPPHSETLWHDVHIQLLDEVVPGQTDVQATGQVLVPPSDCQFGVISDIDDTILQTHATDLWRMAKLTFLRNARTRMPFEGVAAFYRALQRGRSGANHNPIFYVSSSAWNLYDLLVDFCELNSIPAGPLLLRDLGTGKNPVVKAGHAHKLEKIERILHTYPDLPFVLIGDSGQDDPQLYRQAVLDFPGRILAIYVRDIIEGHREHVAEMAQEVAARGVEMRLVADTFAAAEHAVERGLIAAGELPEIRRETGLDREESPLDDRLAPV